MPKPSAQVTAAEIARLAGVTRATVSNWRRRHADFPAPTGGTEASPLYDLVSVQAWLAGRGQSTAASPSEELRAALRLGGRGAADRMLPLVLTAAAKGAAELAELAKLPDAGLVDWARAACAEPDDELLRGDPAEYGVQDAGILRALLLCVKDEGGTAALDLLAERSLEDSASSGAYATPAPLAELMARLLVPAGKREHYPARVFDPACGRGSLLVAAAELGASELFAQDVFPVQAQRTFACLRLTTPATTIVAAHAGDSLRNDAFPGLEADAALSNPPFGIRDWGHDELAYDPRWAYGVPPSGESELAWVQHVLAHLAPGAHAVMLLPPATASRATGRRVRTELLRAGALRAVIALPPGAAIPFHIGLHLWILQRPAATGAEPHTTVLFAELSTVSVLEDAGSTSARTTSGRTRANQGPIDWAALTAKALGTWERFRADPTSFPNDPGVARAVPVIELLDDLVDITPARHVRTAPTAANPRHIAAQAEQTSSLLRASIDALTDAAHVGTWPPAGETPRQWRTATVADLARGGALTVLRANPASARDDDAPITIEGGDVLMNRTAAAAAANAAGATRVADENDAGDPLDPALILFRSDQRRLDPWFLAGFLAAQDNINSATTGTMAIQIDPKRLRVPLLPLDEQRTYGDAFRRVHALHTAARDAAELVASTAELLTLGLTSGTLTPPGAASGNASGEAVGLASSNGAVATPDAGTATRGKPSAA